jgi:hypothetical protein
VTGHLAEAVPLVESMGTRVDGEDVKHQVLIPLGCGVDEGLNEWVRPW